jgi:hypothetical protein
MNDTTPRLSPLDAHDWLVLRKLGASADAVSEVGISMAVDRSVAERSLVRTTVSLMILDAQGLVNVDGFGQWYPSAAGREKLIKAGYKVKSL